MHISSKQTNSGATVKMDGAMKRLSNYLSKTPNAVVALFGAYFLLQIVVRYFTPPTLRVDEAQQVLFAQWLALGYDAQPPLYNWYQQAIFALFGTSMVTIAFAKNLILFLTFAVYIKTAELVLENKRFVAVSAFALFIIPQVFWQAQRDLTHTAMLMLTFALLIYGSIRLIKRPSTVGYVLIGVIAGLGMLSKYNFALALPAVLVAVWFHPQGRERLLDKRFALTILASLVVFLPHLLWLTDNLIFASEVTLERMAEGAPESRFLQIAHGLGRFISGSLIIIALPALLLFLATIAENKISHRSQSVWFRFFLNYFIAMVSLMAIVILMTTMTELRDRWLLPLLMPAPILAVLYLERSIADSERFIAKFLPIPLVALVVVPLVLVLSHPLFAALGRASNSNYNWAQFKSQVIDAGNLSPSVIVTPNWPTGGNVRFNFSTVPVASTTYDDYDPAFTLSEHHPALLVWTGDENKLPLLLKWLEEQLNAKFRNVPISIADVQLYYPVENKVMRVYYALVRPSDIER